MKKPTIRAKPIEDRAKLTNAFQVALAQQKKIFDELEKFNKESGDEKWSDSD